MTKTALTDAFLRKLKPTGLRFEITDAATTGLRVRVAPTGEISFVLKARGGPAASPITVTLGRYPDLSLKQARAEATQKRLDLKAGRDLNAERRARRDEARATTNAPTLRELLREFEREFGTKKVVWGPAGPRTQRSQAGRVVESVFTALLDHEVTMITENDFALALRSHKRVRPATGLSSKASGQASRARAYLRPVLDWAAGRKSYAKIGASRIPHLDVVGLGNVHDPASDDPMITGKRIRVLTQDELQAVLPLLKYPAPRIGSLLTEGHLDYRPIAMRFILLTAARLDEVCAMRWRDVDRRNSAWNKPKVKSTRGGPRSQCLPLSGAAMDLLRSLPGWQAHDPADFVFLNSTGKGPLGNWNRFQQALNAATGTHDWHRHDLRRTAATLMHSLKVPVSTIEHILAHTQPFKAENAGGAASHYLQLTQIMTNSRDPQEEALSILADVLERIETGAV
jgi:integrase